jgi:hypothetical protein
MKKTSGKGVGGKKNPNKTFNAVVKKPTPANRKMNKSAKVNPAPGKKGSNVC